MGQDRKTDIARCQEIAPGVHCQEIGKGISRSNVYFVQSGASWVLIDAASAGCAPLMKRTAGSLFGANTRPASILLTHDHPDHAGSALELARTWDCPVYVHPDELPLATILDLSTIEKYANPLDRWLILPLLRVLPRRRVQSMLSKSSLKPVVQAFDPEGGVPGLPDWQCIHTPGHTPGHVAFFRPADRILITGDALLTVDLNSIWRFSLWALRQNRRKVSGPPWYSTWNRLAAGESVMLLARLEPRVLAPGHGLPISGERMASELRACASC
jgi:glyoxylase-like metal-dependent hydrolase (beta-lactamase superfamily II)